VRSSFSSTSRGGGVRAAHRRVHQRVRDRRGDGGTDRHARGGLGSTAPRLPAGWALTRFSRQYVVLVSGAMLTVGALGVALAPGVPTLMAAAFAIGLASGVYFVAANPFIAELFPTRVGRVMGVHGMASQLAAVARRAGRHGRALVRLAARLLRARARLGRLHRRLRRLGPPDGPPGRRRGRHRFRRRALGVEADFWRASC